jgi:hypothetical protein
VCLRNIHRRLARLNKIDSRRKGLRLVSIDYVELEENGQHIYIATPEARGNRGGTASGPLDRVTKQIDSDEFGKMTKSIGELMKKAFDRIEHVDKVTVEVGLDIGYKDGQLIALLLRGNVSATFKLTMEWSK